MRKVNARSVPAWSARLALIGAVACGSAAQGRGTAPAGSQGQAGGQAAARAPDLPWLAGSWRTANGTAVEHWTAIGDMLVGVGFGADGGATRSFEVMVVRADGERLVFTARPNGGSPVAFPEESRGERAIAFANPQHDDPKRVAYRADGDRLIAATEGPSGRQEWQLERIEAAPAPEIEKLAARRGDRAVRVSAMSPSGDAGFSIARDTRDRERLTVWRREPTGRWVAVFDLRLTG